jgi:hypothetical protein
MQIWEPNNWGVTTVNIPIGFYTPQIYSHGALGFTMQQINIFIFFL